MNIKVDREERPDIDAWLQKTLQVLGRPGGWPLTIFLTPKGEPFWGGTYFPKDESFGRVSFKTVLRQLAQAYQENPDQMEPNVRQIAQRMDEAWYQNRAGTFDMSKLERIAVATAQNCDIFYGGVTGAPKFPNVPIIELVWRAYLRTGMQQFLSLALCTLDYMGRGGIYDHLGGGFSRYTIDEEWQIPHFEKMLYDNAQMIDLMTLVWQHGRQPVLKQRIEETIGWVLREMLVENAAFASSLDADSDGEEGKFYVWTESEIDSALAGTNVDRFKQAYGVTRDGNFPHEGKLNGRNILHRVANLADWSEAEEPSFTEQRMILLAAREKRTKPGRDDKVLVDWNGLMIASLANARLGVQPIAVGRCRAPRVPLHLRQARRRRQAVPFLPRRTAAISRLMPTAMRTWRARLSLCGKPPANANISIARSRGRKCSTSSSGTSSRAAMSSRRIPTCPNTCARAPRSTPRRRRRTAS